MNVATDNVKALAKRSGKARAAIREMATDLGIPVSYSPERHTWFLATDATTVRRFNEILGV